MIHQTITWSFFYKDEARFTAEDLGIKEDKNAQLETYLNGIKKQKKRLDTEGVTSVVVYHTLLYDSQCNTEFSPKILSLLQDLNATFCISADRVASDEPDATPGIQIINPNGFKGDTLYQILDKIRERPAMYTGEHSLSAMYHFINGFHMAHNYETSETPSFDGFNDFVGKFYGKYTTAGWKNLILADHFGNEHEALTRFYVLLDEFRAASEKPNSRAIVLKLLERGITDLAETEAHKADLKDVLHLISSQLNTAIYGGISVWYDTILDDIFLKARDNNFLHNWLKTTAPKLVFYEYELWSGSNGKNTDITLIPSNHTRKELVLKNSDVLIKTFFALNEEKAQDVKEIFMAEGPLSIKSKKRLKMTIIDSLSTNYDQYLSQCLDVLTTKTDIIDLDFSKGETDRTRLLFIEKRDLTKYHAIAILTMRLKLFEEEWNDFKNYKKEDFERWIGLLEKQYEGSLHMSNVEIDDFKYNHFMVRLTTKKGLTRVEHNGQVVDFLAFKRTNPLFHEQIMSVSKTKFQGLKEEFYIETSHHFVLFNWFTTA